MNFKIFKEEFISNPSFVNKNIGLFTSRKKLDDIYINDDSPSFKVIEIINV